MTHDEAIKQAILTKASTRSRIEEALVLLGEPQDKAGRFAKMARNWPRIDRAVAYYFELQKPPRKVSARTVQMLALGAMLSQPGAAFAAPRGVNFPFIRSPKGA